MPKGRPKGTFRARIELPGGRIVIGWANAAAALGRKSAASLMGLAEFDEARQLYTFPALPTRQPVSVRLPDGRVVRGWRAALDALGRRSSGSLRALAVRGDDGVYEVPQ
jgi:hypothetical protein